MRRAMAWQAAGAGPAPTHPPWLLSPRGARRTASCRRLLTCVAVCVAAALGGCARGAWASDVARQHAQVAQMGHPHIARASKCLDGCTLHGTCNEEIGRCDCPKHRSGPACQTLLDPPQLRERCTALLYPHRKECLATDPGPSCLNECNQRGVCVSGFCHCRPGSFGADCSLSLGEDGRPVLLANSTWRTRQKRPWVYVYELPPHLTSWVNAKRLDRPTHTMFWQRLLGSGARVADPEQADLFYIPIRQRGMHDRQWLAEAVDYVRRTWPFYDRFHGHRHFLFHTGDLGKWEADRAAVEAADNVTWLTHWGLYKDHKLAGWKAAHRPGKDIVVPVLVSAGHYKHFGMDRTPLHPMFPQGKPKRNKVLFFAGRICGNRQPPDSSKPWPHNCGPGNDFYSAGVRQAVHAYHANRTGWKVVVHERNYGRALATHKFCLAPLGGGHGQRQVLVAFMGCVPVTIGDGVLQPFEPEVPWARFSVQVAEQDVPRLHEALAQVDDGAQLARMQRALRCAAQHLIWTGIMGGFLNETGKYDAFETILEILRVQQAHPGAKPEDYTRLDADFRRFVNCGADGDLGGEEGAPGPDGDATSSAVLPDRSQDEAPQVCTHSILDKWALPCQRCLVGASPTHGFPGGVQCCRGSSRGTRKRVDMSLCPRPWP